MKVLSWTPPLCKHPLLVLLKQIVVNEYYRFAKGPSKEIKEYEKLKSISRYFLASFFIFAAFLKFSLKTVMPST